jgi:hypothetical protein
MIHVLIRCAKSPGRTVAAPDGGCPEFQAALAPHNIEAWVEKTLRENGWYTHPDRDDYYCPVHNPSDQGVVMPVNHAYRPLGNSGWEARLPQGFQGSVNIEIRPRRRFTASDPQPPAGTTVIDDTGCRWTRQYNREPCGWISEHDTEAVDPESWTKVAGNYGPVMVVATDG